MHQYHFRMNTRGEVKVHNQWIAQAGISILHLPEHFERYLPEYPNLDELKAHYTRGGLGDMKVKKFLAAIMQEELTPIRERRREFEKDIPGVYEMLKKGCEAAREMAAQTMSEVRQAMKIDYFNDAALIEEQQKRFSAE